MDIGLMFEGQDGLNWPRWKRILQAAQELGYAHVFRSDHFTNASPPDKDSLECWSSLLYAAASTERIEFGPLVSPVTFRHPSILARMAAATDDLSGGRLTLGVGVGWQDREHHNFGIPFPSVPTRYEMLVDELEIITRLFRSDEPVTYEGTHFSLHDAVLLPRPQRSGGPTIMIGGNGEKRTMPLAARYADEWNTLFVRPERFREKNDAMDELLARAGRSPASVRRSLMVGTIFAPDEHSLAGKLVHYEGSAQVAQHRGLVAGTPPMWVEQLRAYRDAGVQRIMLQWLEQDFIEGLEMIARDVLPQVAAA